MKENKKNTIMEHISPPIEFILVAKEAEINCLQNYKEFFCLRKIKACNIFLNNITKNRSGVFSIFLSLLKNRKSPLVLLDLANEIVRLLIPITSI